ncbi:MAG: hypothetical protein M3N28_00255 [Actinomycetota bacterium]|nr:hypothetical protein [Actinomycetota bacterium]
MLVVGVAGGVVEVDEGLGLVVDVGCCMVGWGRGAVVVGSGPGVDGVGSAVVLGVVRGTVVGT